MSVLESEERPTKLRKLSHDHTTAEDDVALIANKTPEQSSVEVGVSQETQHNQSEHTDPAANEAAVSDKHHSREELQPDPVHTQINPEPVQPTPPLSKNQLKKQRKKEEWEAGKQWRKARQKEKDAEKKARKREQNRQEREERVAQGLESQSQEKTSYRRPIQLPVTFLIDCGFDDKMLEKERISLGSQVTRAYSDNSKAPFQARLMISSWGGLLKERFDTVLSGTYVKWRGVEFREEDFVAAAERAKSKMTSEGGGKLAGIFEKYDAEKMSEQKPETTNGTDSGHGQQVERVQILPIGEAQVHVSMANAQVLDKGSETIPEDPTADPTDFETLKQQGEVIYLTSDSPYTLHELKPYSTYIIGGLVDKNRHKGICYKSARAKGIKTAKLPIGQYMEMQSRYVLATNHVVEIMVYWLECGDWGEAFMKAIPKRKGGKLKNGQDKDRTSSDHGDAHDGSDGSEDEADEAEGNLSSLDQGELQRADENEDPAIVAAPVIS